MNKLRAAAYCRVSTDRAEQSGSLASQRSFFDDYIRNSDSMTLVGVFYDEGISGTTTLNRYGFNKMISLAVSGGIDIILTKEVSRFARNTVDTLNITRMLRAKGVGIIFINDNIDTRDSDGELRLSIMATIAQEESRKISERVRAGQATSRANHVLYGNGNIIGYDRVGPTYVINEEQAETIRTVYTLYSQGLGEKAIVNELGLLGCKDGRGKVCWSCAKVSRILRNKTYMGMIGYRKSAVNNFL